jgi:Ig-like domain from next to BRCA1 gene
MEEKERKEELAEEQPEVYTVKKDLTGWQFDRRTFLAAAGATAAVAAVGTATSCGSPTPPEQVVVVDVVATATSTPPPVVGGSIGVPSEIPPTAVPTVPGETPMPSNTPVPSEAVAPTPTSTSTSTAEKPKAEFVKDVTIPDGTQMKPNQAFTKTWRYRNSGTVPWGDGVQLVFVPGTIQGYQSNQMGGPDAVDVPNVAPGDTVDISVNLVAPAKPARYRGYWRLRLPNGEWLENNHYVDIVVPNPASATPRPTATQACDCVGHTGCGCDKDCGCIKDKPTHYWHPN